MTEELVIPEIADQVQVSGLTREDSLRTCALMMAVKYYSETIIKDGVMYQTKISRGENLEKASHNGVLQCAVAFERYLRGDYAEQIEQLVNVDFDVWLKDQIAAAVAAWNRRSPDLVEALEAARKFAEAERERRYAAIVDNAYSQEPGKLISQIDAALRRAKGEAAVSEWKPIESAPTGDCDKILLGIVRGGRLEEVHIGGWNNGSPGADDEPCWWSDQADDEIRPSIWMPLPEPPTGGRDEI